MKFFVEIVEPYEFNITEERHRIADMAVIVEPDEDGYTPTLPPWVIQRLSDMCDAVEEQDMQKMLDLYNISLYDDRRHNDTIVAEYFPLIVDTILSAHTCKNSKLKFVE